MRIKNKSKAKNMMKFILFGGSFDPIHDGHYLMAKQAYQQIKADKVIFIPAKRPRWKEVTKNSDEHRYNMLNPEWSYVGCYGYEGGGMYNYIQNFASSGKK